MALVGLALSSSASVAADPEFRWDACGSSSAVGQRCSIPRGIAADPSSGHVFVADQVNRRIVELTASGTFIKTWGWDVVASGPGDDTTVPEDQFEICIPAKADVCKEGTSGAGMGQLGPVLGLAIDSEGSIYAVEFSNRRIEKFSSDGNFELMFGGDVNKTKVDEGAPEAEQNLCTAASGDVCQGGTEGTGNGQFGAWAVGSFIAADLNGTETDLDDVIYVGDQERIQIFGADGHYVGEVPKDPTGLLKENTVQSLASDASGSLYVIYNGVPDVRKLTPAGEELDSPRFKAVSSDNPDLNPAPPTAVAVDSSNNVYAFGPTSANAGQLEVNPVFVFDPAGNLVSNFGKGEFDASTGLATNLCPGNVPPGNLYVSNSVAVPNSFVRAYGTPPINCGKAITGAASNIAETSVTLNGKANPKGIPLTDCFFEYGVTITYGQTAPCEETSGEIGAGSDPVPVHADIGALSAGTVYHFRLTVGIAGEVEEGTDATFKTLGPPTISGEHTVGATENQAFVRALVNPEGLPTTYHFEYGTSTSYDQSTPPIAIGSDRADHPVVATLDGLTPGVTYHWRTVASNASDVTLGNDRTFTTFFSSPAEPDGCVNAIFRTAASAFLPDCRAYELVSPVDKNGNDIVAPSRVAIQTSPDGEKIAYETFSSFGNQPSDVGWNQYLATREDDHGWSNEGIHPPLTGSLTSGVQLGISHDFMAFSRDLCDAWLIDFQTPPLTEDGQPGYRNLYRRDNCGLGAGSLEALAPSPPSLPASTPVGYVTSRSVEGYSEDSRHALFTAEAKLTPEAHADAGGQDFQIYDRIDGALALVSILPDSAGGDPVPGDGMGFADKANAAIGSGWERNLDHAVSSDGSRVYWTSGIIFGGSGKVYLRKRPEQGNVAGECAAGKACTIPVSPDKDALYWSAATDGSKALYSEQNLLVGPPEALVEFDLKKAEESQPPRRLVASHVIGVAGVSDDLSRIYFVSTDVLAGAGQNSEGNMAQAGDPNLYLDDGGTLSFVATLSKADIDAFAPYNVVDTQSRQRPTRVSPDGAQIVFQSQASLTGFDNRDVGSGEATVEVFRYEAGGQLLCVSCNPSGAQPISRELRKPFVPGWVTGIASTGVSAAAWIPTWERALFASNALSESGGRLFFNSNDALVPRDTNGTMDVYEWEVQGEGSCTAGSPSFHVDNGGCISLISSGESPFESEFWGASADGDDVFFTTESSLLPQDPGLIDLYDARVGGGFSQPVQKAACEGEACQSPPLPPARSTPASSAYSGPANPGKRKPPCPRGKRKVLRGGKVRCVKHAHRKHKRRTHHKRGVAK